MKELNDEEAVKEFIKPILEFVDGKINTVIIYRIGDDPREVSILTTVKKYPELIKFKDETN